MLLYPKGQGVLCLREKKTSGKIDFIGKISETDLLKLAVQENYRFA